MHVTRRRLVLGSLGLTVLGLAGRARPLAAEQAAAVDSDMRFFRIGTGSTAGTYFPIGGLLAAAISNPPGSHPCEEGGACGVPGLIAVAQSTEGSVDNVRRIAAGTLESAPCQADVAHWAATGEGRFNASGPVADLRVIASLYPELLHLAARRGAGIRHPADLAGKRVSLDREGSGTRVDALLLLEAFGVRVDSFEEVPLAAGQAAEALRKGELDAFFLVAGAPVGVMQELAEQQLVELVPLAGEEMTKLTERYPFLMLDAIPAGTYQNLSVTPTLSVSALWVVSATVDTDLVRAITATLWNAATRILLDAGHPRAQQILLENALKGIGEPPLHPGAADYYRTIGLLVP